jgi:hypothetical protein
MVLEPRDILVDTVDDRDSDGTKNLIQDAQGGRDAVRVVLRVGGGFVENEDL